MVLGTGGGDIERRDARVRIVLKGQFDEPLEPRIAEKLAPADIGCSSSALRTALQSLTKVSS